MSRPKVTLSETEASAVLSLAACGEWIGYAIDDARAEALVREWRPFNRQMYYVRPRLLDALAACIHVQK